MMYGFQIVVWGAGTRGKRLLSKLGRESILAFIDTNPALIGQCIETIPVISYEEYKEEYSDFCILISPLKEKEIIEKLVSDNIVQFFLYSQCPGELQDEISDLQEFRRYVTDKFSSGDYGIYGLSLYSVLLHHWIREDCNRNVCFYVNLQKDGKIADYLKRRIPDISIKDVSEVCRKEKRLLISVKENIEKVIEDEEIELLDAFNFSNRKNTSDVRIKQLKNFFAGKRGFIVGTGPSLRMQDLDLLYEKKQICFSMNGVFHAFDRTKWRPDVFVACDRKFIKEQDSVLEDLPIEIKLISDFGDTFWNKKRNTSMYCYHSYWGIFDDREPFFSEDCSKVVYEVGTVSYACIQFAVYMGIKEIYLLGMDFSITGQYKNKSNHFIENYYSKNSDTGQFYRNEQLLAFSAAKQYAEEHGIKIYNATRGGKLEVFERVDFDSLFEKESGI